ncbi:MAG: restriction endonuclease subunit S [Acidimicrobiia bacterium]
MKERPEGWERSLLGEMVKIEYGKGLRAADRSGTGEFSVIGSSGVVGTHSQSLTDGPVIVVGRKGNVGAAYLAEKPSWPIDTTYYFEVPSQWEAKFVCYQINHLGLDRLDSSTAVPSLRRPDLEGIELAGPDRDEQQRIVEVIEEQFSRLDAGVESLQRAKRNLTRLRASLLSAAVEGRLGASQSSDETANGLPDYVRSTSIQSRLSGRQGNSRKPQPPPETTAVSLSLPTGWQWVSIDQIASRIEYGTSTKAGSDSTGGVPVLRMGNIVEGTIDFSRLKFLPAEHPDSSRFVLEPGDLLFNRTNSPELVGKSAVFQASHMSATFASYLIRVQFLPGVVPHYVAYVINSPFGRSYIARVRSQQVGQANVNGSKLAAFPVPLPPTSEQHRIVAEVERQFSIIDAMAKTIDAGLQRVGALRQSILSKAFSGRLTGLA